MTVLPACGFPLYVPFGFAYFIIGNVSLLLNPSMAYLPTCYLLAAEMWFLLWIYLSLGMQLSDDWL